ncbi:hypothetical protein [Geobacillus stearothermophilus]|nr:hypothetical protein [Geobacillus stearothermophilus]MED3740105.1 hypothetical protein [Geobacillus stearothermophilus]MED3765960.1 hypothetical protein [Geobacillus stearothermophilus]MED3773739.1 hypothetical protein [Geobacillus stearothermophilus]
MAMLTTQALQKIASVIDQNCVSADYTVDGRVYQGEIRRSIISGTSVIKHVYLTTKDPIGRVTKVRLLDANGNVFAELTTDKMHEKNKGRLFEFKFTVQEG